MTTILRAFPTRAARGLSLGVEERAISKLSKMTRGAAMWAYSLATLHCPSSFAKQGMKFRAAKYYFSCSHFPITFARLRVPTSFDPNESRGIVRQNNFDRQVPNYAVQSSE